MSRLLIKDMFQRWDFLNSGFTYTLAAFSRQPMMIYRSLACTWAEYRALASVASEVIWLKAPTSEFSKSAFF
jgi:hypothetical protein